MARCTYIDSCPFPNEKLAKMPVTATFMADNYCYWDFTKCVIYRTVVDTGIQPDAACCSSDKILNWLFCGRMGG